MPIRPENRNRYGPDWPEFSRRIRFERAEGRCECEGECGRGTPQRGRPPAPKPVSVWAQLLGATPAPAKRRSPLTETNVEKRARVMRRIDERMQVAA